MMMRRISPILFLVLLGQGCPAPLAGSRFSDRVTRACTAYTEAEIETMFSAAEIDRERGFTRTEIFLQLGTSCQQSAIPSACITCTTAIVDEVWSR